MRRIRRFLSEAGIAKSTIALLVALLASRAGAAQGTTSAFVPGTREIYSLDLTSVAPGTLPKSISVMRGKPTVVQKAEGPVLKASEPSEFLISLPELLPDGFTIEVELTPKVCCAPEDIAFEGTREISRSTTSMHVVWNTETIIAVGGGEYVQIPMPQELKEVIPGEPTKIAASFQGTHFRLFTNGRQLLDLPNKRFARGRVLRVSLGGQDDDQHAVYLSKLRIAAIDPGAVATTPVAAVTTTTMTTATGMTSAPPPSVAAPTATAPLSTTDKPISSVPNTSAALDQGLLVGTGVSDITGPISEIVMMGYAEGDQKAAGLHTRLHARAFIFVSPKTSKRVVWVNTELAMLFSSVKQGVLKKLAAKYGTLYTDQNVMISATHTHSGPGGYSHHTIYNFSIKGFVTSNYNGIVDGITEAIVQAHNRLGPGSVTMMSGQLAESTMVNRSKVAFMLDPEALAVPPAPQINREMTLLKIIGSGRPIGAIAFHAVHNTSMPKTNRLVSSDHKGYAAYLLEKQYGSVAPFQRYGDFIAAFPNGAEGDMSPNIDTSRDTVFVGPSPDPFESSKIIGTREFNAAFGLFNSTAAEDIGSDVDYRHKFVLMPGTPVPSSNFTNGAGLKTLCTGAYGFSFMAGAEDGRTGMLSEGISLASTFDKTVLDAERQLALGLVMTLMPALSPVLTTLGEGFMTASSDQCQFPKPILLPTGYLHWSPEILPFQIFRIGNLAIAGIPGEMTMQAGRRMEDAIKAVLLPLGVKRVLLTGLANEYSGYITTPEEYVSQQYEGASTLFGRLTFDAYKEAFRDLGVALASGKDASSGPPPGDLSAGQIEWSTDVDHDEVPAGETFGQILKQPPDTVVRGPNTQVQVIYRSGNPRYDFRRNDTYFRIERDIGGGNWALAAWDGIPETRLGWSRSTAVPNSILTPNAPSLFATCPAEPCYWSTMGIVWFVPNDATPGQYRIRVFGKWKNGVTNQLIAYEGMTKTFTLR